MEGLGTGLAALAFWGFLSAVVVAGIWYSVREKEAQHETMRRIVESGQPIDENVIEKVFRGESRPDRDLKIAAMIVIACAPGLAVLGYFLSLISEKALMPLLGVDSSGSSVSDYGRPRKWPSAPTSRTNPRQAVGRWHRSIARCKTTTPEVRRHYSSASPEVATAGHSRNWSTGVKSGFVT